MVKADVASLVQYGGVDLTGWELSPEQVAAVGQIVDEYAERSVDN